MHRRILYSGLLALAVVMAGCSSTRPYTLAPVRTVDPDRRPIEKPGELQEDFRWDAFYLSTFYRLEQLLDLNRAVDRAGRLFGLDAYDEADNVNALDEPPESSWYAYRHFYAPMTEEALRRGPDTTPGPDASTPLTVIEGKSEGINPGFFVEDGRGDVYLLKLDDVRLPELSSSSEVIATKIYHAAGYNVPQNTIFYFRPDQLVLGEEATVTEDGEERPMTRADVEHILSQTSRTPDGRVRALASKFVDGEPVGIWEFRGVREDDPNDRVLHEQRRELRGLRVLASWLNDTDRRNGNTMAVYTDGRYVEHYLLDMGSTLGTGSVSLRDVKKGHAYRYDVGNMLKSLLALGLWVKPWVREVGDSTDFYPSVGYFESELFDPGGWVPSYPNPAFDHATPRDGYWGAKLVMAFTDDDLRAIVDEARLTDPEARAYLLRILRERRDKIGRYWFSRVNPLDRFHLETPGDPLASAGPTDAAAAYRLHFDDLAVEGGLADAGRTTYHYRIRQGEAVLVGEAETADTAIPLPLPRSPSTERVLDVRIRTRRGGDLSEPVHVYVHFPRDAPARLAGIER